MKTRQLILLTCMTLFSGCIQNDKEPSPHSYSSILDSKKNKVFINRYNPQSPILSIEGIDFKISAAWVEHPHYWNGGDFISCKDFDFVMTFENTDKNDIDFQSYTKNLTGGHHEIWFFISNEEYSKDTLILWFKEKKNSKKQKKFYLVKIKGN
jgi:hypothetical protein